jgi:hypothetical protein
MQIFGLLFSNVPVMFFLTRNGLGYILGEFFTNVSCHRVTGTIFKIVPCSWNKTKNNIGLFCLPLEVGWFGNIR